ncbi:hypothetical protein [Pontibacterium sp.]|uniref:hypothetical protein n=1 Tax=Pontibacterium sp. TaxID=2036026 RepID=UPI0035170F48
MKHLNKLLLMVGALWLTGCSLHPLGIDDEEWAVMTREEQLRAYEKQAELDKVRAEAQARERAAKAEAEARKYEAMAYLRQNAQYGDIVQCVLDPVDMQFSSKWKPAKPQAFDLVRGEQLTLRMQDWKERYSSEASVSFAESGLEVELCRNSSYRYGGDCTRVLGTSRDFRRGISKSFEIDRYMKGTLRCDLKPIRRH